MATHLLFKGKLIYSPKPPKKGDTVIRVLPKSFISKDADIWKIAHTNSPSHTIKHGKNVIHLRLEKTYPAKGSDLFLRFQRFEDFSDYFNFDRYYPVRRYTITGIEDRIKQLNLDCFF